MTDRDAFLTAIAGAPGEDVPRLAYADWLEERGESDRAEYIRLSVATRRVNFDPAACSRLDELDAEHKVDWWFGALPLRPRSVPYTTSPQDPGISYKLDGGLADIVWVRGPVGDFLEPLARLVASEPVRVLALNSGPYSGLFEAMASWPQLTRIRAMYLSGNFDPQEMTLLGRNPYLTNLYSLGLFIGPVAAVEALAAEELPTRLTEVGFKCPYVSDRRTDNTTAVASLLNRSKITELSIGGMTVEETLALLGSVDNPSITSLDLKDAGLHDPALPAVERFLGRRKLESLNLRVNYFSADRLRDLFRSPDLEQLTRLWASNCITYNREAGRDVWSAITESAFAPNLTHLDFSFRPGLTAGDLGPLSSGRMPRLRNLSLGPASFGDEGLRQIIASPVAANLQVLNLYDCGVTDAGARALTRDAFPCLEWLCLSDNHCSQGAKSWLLDQFGQAVRLERLH